MSTTALPVSGSFGGRKSQPVRNPAAPETNGRVQAAPASKRIDWMRFGSHMATWATAGRLPLSE